MVVIGTDDEQVGPKHVADLLFQYLYSASFIILYNDQ